jgi:hypothetical protein
VSRFQGEVHIKAIGKKNDPKLEQIINQNMNNYRFGYGGGGGQQQEGDGPSK